MGSIAPGILSPLIPVSLHNISNTKEMEAVDDLNHSMKPSVPSYKWRMVIAYDGTRFSGWQYQQSPPTVQCITEKALMCVTKLDRKDLCLVGASRTDTGVHAWGQVAHFVTPFSYDSLESVHAAINGLLPKEIQVREFSPACPEFHARFSTTSKIYHYKIYNDPVMDPFHRLYAYHSAYKLNPCPMREAAKYFVGRHDFSAFANASKNDRSPIPVKEIFRFDVIEMGAILQLEVEGSGFLYRQVRNMVALLLQIGREALPPDIVPMILASRDRRELAKFSLSAPPHGLCLMAVNYNQEVLQPPPDRSMASFGRTHSINKFTSLCSTHLAILRRLRSILASARYKNALATASVDTSSHTDANTLPHTVPNALSPYPTVVADITAR